MRRNVLKTALRGAGALLLVTLLTACAVNRPPSETTPAEKSPEEPVWDGVWLVYWDAQGVSEAAGRQPSPKTNVAFACYYDDAGAIYIPDALTELCGEIKALPGAHYLSVTNDVQHADGTVTQKDPEILSLLFSGGEATAQALLDQVRQLGFDGLEIDFENIRALPLWQRYAEFLSLLWVRASASGISLRVVLPFSTPVEDVPLPEGPAYTVMCYNLFGTQRTRAQGGHRLPPGCLGNLSLCPQPLLCPGLRRLRLGWGGEGGPGRHGAAGGEPLPGAWHGTGP